MADFTLWGPSGTAESLTALLSSDGTFTLWGPSGTAISLTTTTGEDVGEFTLWGPSGTALSLTAGAGESPAPPTPGNTGFVTPLPMYLFIGSGEPGNVTDFPVYLNIAERGTPDPITMYLAIADTAQLDTDTLRWTATITLDGDDITEFLIGNITVEAEEAQARIARFSMRMTGPISLPDIVGKRVTIDFVQLDADFTTTILSARLFTGAVDVPTFDPNQDLVSFLCTDNLNGILGKTPRPALDQVIGGFWSDAVFNPFANSLEYAQSLAATILGSVDLDPYQQLRNTPWQAKDPADFTVDETRGIYGTPSVELANRSQIKNMIELTFQYRYPRLKYRTTSVSWDMGKTLGELFLSDFTIPTRASIQSAAGGLSGWDVLSISYVPPPPTQTIAIPGGVGFWICSPIVQQQLAWKAGIALSRRWVQTITELYTIIVTNESSTAALGPLIETETANVEVGATSFDAAGWEADKTTGFYKTKGSREPVPPYVANNEWFYDVTGQPKVTRADANQAILTLENKAKARILGTHRLNRVKFQAPINPFYDLCHTIRLDTAHLTATGKASHLSFALDPASGKATVQVELAISGIEAVGLQEDVPLSAPPQPILPGPLSQPVIPLPTLFGGNTASIFPQPELAGNNLLIAVGYHGNQQGGAGFDETKPYTVGFRVRAPAVAAADVDPLTVAQYQSFTGRLTADVHVTPTPDVTIQVNSQPTHQPLPFTIVVATAPHTVILPSGTVIAQSGDEQMTVTAIVGSTWQVTRGVNGTTPLAHFTNDIVSIVGMSFPVAIPQDELVLTG